MWLVFAVLSAVFAALTSILAKVGIDNVNSNLATAIRTLVVLVMAWVMVFATGAQAGAGTDHPAQPGFSGAFGAGDGRILAVLLPRHPARQRVQRWCPSIK